MCELGSLSTEQARDEIEKDVNGQILRDGVQVRTRLAVYFQQKINVEFFREANIIVVGDRRKPVLGGSNERTISIEAVKEAEN